MSHPDRLGRWRSTSALRGPILRVIGIVIAGLLLVPVLHAQAADSDLDGLVGLERMAAWFDAHPEYKEMKSSGWKPYNREVWLQETRPIPESLSAGHLRHQILLEAKAQFAESRTPGWFCIGPVEFSGRCLAIDFHPTDPNIVYVGSAAGGLWKSTDGGSSWMTSTDDLPTLAIGAVCVLPWDPAVVLIGTGEGTGVGYVTAGKGIFGIGLLRSTDAGATWNKTSLSYSIPSGHGFSVIAANPITHTLLAGANDGLWRSTDDGETWTRVASNGNYFDVKWKPGDANEVYVAKGRDPFLNFQADNGVLLSTDDGLTFALAGTGQPSGAAIGKTKISVTPGDPNVIYAHYVNASNYHTLGVYRSLDGGTTWEARNTSLNMCGGQGWYNNVIVVDPNNSERLVAGGNVLYTSDNGGVSFTPLNASIPFGNAIAPHWDNHALAYEPGSESILWITTDGGPWRSVDDGAIWTRRTAGIVSYQFYDIGVAQSDPLFMMGGTQDNGMPGRIDADSWFQSTMTVDGFVCNVVPTDASIVYSEWQGGNHVKSTDGGQNWSAIQNGISGSGSWLTPVDLDQKNQNHLYTETSYGIFRTTNGGGLWENVGAHRARWISMHPNNGNIVWTVSPSAGVWHTTDDGASWIHSDGFPGNGLETKIQADPSDVASAFVTLGGYANGGPHILRTTDFGDTWTDVTGDFPDQPANTLAVDPAIPNDWYVGSDVGVWKSSDGGAHWEIFGTDLANALIADLEIRKEARKLVAGSYGRGVWEVDLLDPASVGGNDPALRDLMLDPPYPNPVADQAIFRFAARSSESVSLEIYDVSGRRVSTVVDGLKGDGLIRMARWSTDELPNGVYLARLRAGELEVSRKILVNR